MAKNNLLNFRFLFPFSILYQKVEKNEKILYIQK